PLLGPGRTDVDPTKRRARARSRARLLTGSLERSTDDRVGRVEAKRFAELRAGGAAISMQELGFGEVVPELDATRLRADRMAQWAEQGRREPECLVDVRMHGGRVEEAREPEVSLLVVVVRQPRRRICKEGHRDGDGRARPGRAPLDRRPARTRAGDPQQA